jgi:hypothetical protein
MIGLANAANVLNVLLAALAALAAAAKFPAAIAVLAAVVVLLAAANRVSADPIELGFDARIGELLANQALAAVPALIASRILIATAPPIPVSPASPAAGIGLAQRRAKPTSAQQPGRQATERSAA